VEGPKFVDAAGTRTRYFEAGAGEPIVLVHGSHFGDPDASALDWEPVMAGFARSFRVYALDKIGQGFTDNPRNDADYVIGTTVHHLHAFIQALNLRGVQVVGHSRGGYCVTRLALEYPEVVKTLVIVGSATLMIPPAKFYDQVEAAAASITDFRQWRRYMLVANSLSPEHVTDGFLDASQEVYRLPKTREAYTKMNGPLRQQFFDDLAVRRAETHQWIKAGGIKAPTLVVWAFNDPSAPVDPVGIAAMNLILPAVPQSEMHVINRAGHYCFREQPDAFVAVVSGFTGAVHSTSTGGRRMRVGQR
jgi:pimeloyl-ACP methyl ester carboxylesterase